GSSHSVIILHKLSIEGPAVSAPMTTPKKEGRLPLEIIEFFNQPGGHSLIVKGPAGTGKTTFALQPTEEPGGGASTPRRSRRASSPRPGGRRSPGAPSTSSRGTSRRGRRATRSGLRTRARA